MGKQYAVEFKESILKRILPPNNGYIPEISQETWIKISYLNDNFFIISKNSPTKNPLFDRGGRADFPPRETIGDCLTETWGERPFLFLFSLVPRRTPPVQSLTKRLFLD